MKIKDMYNKMIDMTNIFGLFIPGEELDSTKTATNLDCLLYTSPSPRDRQKSRMPSSA